MTRDEALKNLDEAIANRVAAEQALREAKRLVHEARAAFVAALTQSITQN